MRKKGFTLIELLVVIAIIAMLLAILMPALSKVKKIAQRVVCGTNLKGLGTAQVVYANDYDDEYVVQGQGFAHNWDPTTPRTNGWFDPEKDWTSPDLITIGASLYLLVREADVSPKSFVCPSSSQSEFDGINTGNYDIVELWDFGSGTSGSMGPQRCVSYSYHCPYAGSPASYTPASTGSKSRFAADGTRSAAFAVMADQNPFFEETLTFGQANQGNYLDMVFKLGNAEVTIDTIDNGMQKYQIEVANALPHDRESQNVLFADGHTSNEKRVDVGIKNDNIYTPQIDNSGAVLSVRTGKNVDDILTDSVPMATSDSILVNDGGLATPG